PGLIISRNCQKGLRAGKILPPFLAAFPSADEPQTNGPTIMHLITVPILDHGGAAFDLRRSYLRTRVMRNLTKLAIGAVLACGAAIATAAPAAAQVSFGIGVGAPVVPVAPAYPAYSCYDPYGNYVYSYPYCTAYSYPAPVYTAPYTAPIVEPYFGIGLGFGGGWGHRDFGHFRGFEHRGFAGGHYAMDGFRHR